jgi:hypothetical protein
MSKKFTGIIVSGRPVTVADGIKAGIIQSKETEKPIGELRMSTELTDEQIEAFRKAWDEPGSLITNNNKEDKS